jgi:hypothetical protein
MSRSTLTPCLLVAGLLAAASTVQAQESPVHWYVLGGYSDTVGSTSNFLQGGYILGGGFSVSPAWLNPLEMRFDLSYSEHNASIALLNAGQQATNQPIDSGTGSILSGTANLVYHIPLGHGVRGYGIAGAGAYYTRIELDQVVPVYGGYGFGYGYGYGYGYGFGEAQVAAHGATNFGWNAGVGLDIALPYGHSWFVEARYHRINSSSSIQYFPIEIGFRF